MASELQCRNCLGSVMNLISCAECTLVAYCSPKCKDTDAHYMDHVIEDEDENVREPIEIFYIEYPSLPVDKPLGFPHLIDCEGMAELDQEDRPSHRIRLPDAIVTFLHRHDPEVLEKFLDQEKYKRVELSRNGDDKSPMTLVIARHDKMVTLDYIAGGEMITGGHCGILKSGEWKPVSGSYEGQWCNKYPSSIASCCKEIASDLLMLDLGLADKNSGTFTLDLSEATEDDAWDTEDERETTNFFFS